MAPLPVYAASPGGGTTVGKLSVVANSPFQFHIDVSAPVNPQVQMIADPDRLVIDLPSTRPSAALRRIAINRASVKGVRASLYSTKPPTTRIVVDLVSPQWYRIAPDSSGLLVTVGGPAEHPIDAASTIGWVLTKSPVAQRARVIAKQPTSHTIARSGTPSFVNGVEVEFQNGMLAIHARNATLSEVLFQIQKKTGAEIAIPAGTEQDRVAGEFGPGRPSEVLDQLLNGSELNFVVVGSASDPNTLRSVILSRKQPDTGNGPVGQAYTPPVAQNAQPEIDPTNAPEGQSSQPVAAPPEGPSSSESPPPM